MPQTPHVEKHFTASQTVRDIMIGTADGLTVPFALAAGLSLRSASSSRRGSSRRVIRPARYHNLFTRWSFRVQ